MTTPKSPLQQLYNFQNWTYALPTWLICWCTEKLTQYYKASLSINIFLKFEWTMKFAQSLLYSPDSLPQLTQPLLQASQQIFIGICFHNQQAAGNASWNSSNLKHGFLSWWYYKHFSLVKNILIVMVLILLIKRCSYHYDLKFMVQTASLLLP